MGIIALVLIGAGALQLYAAFRTSRAEGPLKTQQGRQLEAAFGRKGTIAFFAIIGSLLLAAGAWLAVSAI